MFRVTFCTQLFLIYGMGATCSAVSFSLMSLTPWGIALLEKLSRSASQTPPLIGHEGSLPFTQEPATDPYPEPDPSQHHRYQRFKIHFNITLASIPRSSKWRLPSRVSNENSVCISHVSYYMPHPSHPWFHYPKSIITVIFREQQWTQTVIYLLKANV
jgi:hypothetical protein